MTFIPTRWRNLDKKCNVWVHIAKEHPNKIVHLSKTRMQYGEFQDDSLMELLRCFGKFDILIIDGDTADNKGIYMKIVLPQNSQHCRLARGPDIQLVPCPSGPSSCLRPYKNN